jgi:hypothetical protein
VTRNDEAPTGRPASALQKSAPIAVQAIPTLSGVYANHVNLIRTENELVVDYFAVEPVSGAEAIARHVSRIVLPLTVMKGLRDAITAQVAEYESTLALTLGATQRGEKDLS